MNVTPNRTYARRRALLAIALLSAVVLALVPARAGASPVDDYPRGLAARPLALTAHVAELGLSLTYDLTPGSVSLSDAAIIIRWSPIDRFELRGLGVYWLALPARGRSTEIGVGLGLVGFGASSPGGLTLLIPEATIDLRTHLDARTTIAVSLRYPPRLYFDPGTVLHVLIGTVRLERDLTRFVSVFGALNITWVPPLPPYTLVDSFRVTTTLGAQFTPWRFLDVMLWTGPTWGGSELSARWAETFGATVRGRW